MSSYSRNYVPWSKSNLSPSSYSGSGSSYSSSNPKTSDSATTKPTTTESKYDSGYTGRRYGTTTGTTGSSTGSTTGSTTGASSYRSSYTPSDRVSSTASKYGTTPSSYLSNKDKYSSTPSSTASSTSTTTSTNTKETKETDRPSIREKYNMGPALPTTTSNSTTKDDKSSSRDDRQSLIDKYSTSTSSSSSYPSRTLDSTRSYKTPAASDKKEDTSTGYSSRSLSRSKPDTSAEPEKTTGYNSLSPYRAYGGRTSSTYTRSSSKDNETSSSASTPATTPVSNPTSLRYGSASRYGASITKSPVNTPVPIVADRYRSGRTSRQEVDDIKVKERSVSPMVLPAKEEVKVDKVRGETKTVAVVTRGTSPTPPSTSSFLRTRRADLARVIEKNIERSVIRPEMVDKEIQSDRGDDTARLSRFGSTSRSTVSPWTSYLDRISTTGSGYSPAVSKYSTRSYGTTPTRSEREPTVTRSTPSEATTTASTTSSATEPTTVKDESSKASDKTENKTNLDAEITAVKIGIKKSPSIKKVGGIGLTKATSVTKVNEVGVKTPVGSTKVDDVILKKTTDKIVSAVKTEEKIDDKKEIVSLKVDDAKSKKILPNVTKVTDDVVVKEVQSELKDKVLVRLKRTPSVKKLDDVNNIASTIEETISSKKPSPSSTVDEKSNIKSSAVSEDKLKDEASSVAKKAVSSQKIVDVSKEEKAASDKLPLKSVSRKSSLKSETGTKTEDITALTGALEGLIRANSGQPIGKKLTTKAESLSESESENVKSKSSSSPSLSESEKLKTPPLTPPPPLNKLTSPSLTRKFLPPPVPKSDSNSSLKTLPSQHSLNKDFRKSTLNMDVTNPTEAEELKKAQEKQRKLAKTPKRSTSTGSDVSETSETSEAPTARGRSAPLPPSSPTTPHLKPSNSLSNNTNIASTSTIKLYTLKVPVPSQASRSPSGSRMSDSSSEGESESSESASSSSSEEEEEEEETHSRSSASNLIQSSKSPSLADKNKSLLSPASSKFLQPASSADESSIADKPPRPPSSPKPPQKEEAKSFLMRALAPVTNLFKAKTVESSIDSSNENISESLHRTESTQSLSKSIGSDKEESTKSEEKAKKKPKRICRIESGERAWWLESSDNIPAGVQRIKSSKSVSKLSTVSETDSKKSDNSERKSNLRHAESGERAWWLDSSASIPDGIERMKSNASINRIVESDKESVEESNEANGDRMKRRICKIESGERAWWLESSSNIPEGIERIKSSVSINKTIMESDKDSTNSGEGRKKHKSCKDSSTSSDGVQRVKSTASISKANGEKMKKYSIMHQESGEKAWWMNSSSTNIAESVKKPGSKLLRSSKKDSKTDSSEDESEESENESEEDVKKPTSGLPKFPLELEQPVASSTPKQCEVNTGRTSPYDNVLNKTPVRVNKKRPKNLPLFISNHTNIDDILGSAVTLVNPMRQQQSTALSAESDSADSDDVDGDCKEVDAHQVRIHDSTAQKPVIQRIRDATDGAKRRQSADSKKLDDTALQLYKDGDYGAYLDLEASISEQHEEFDGFQTNRKNSIVLRTQLSVRVHTIIEKLLNSEGRELRRALFSLKQIFQEDKDLVHEFVQNDGLACLIKVGSEADQNYQNYILRALGQVMLYVDGMNGVMDHNKTVQWLYTLIASKFRLVVKTALKLLLVFVEYVDTNCMLLVKAVNAVDSSQGCHPWSNIMRLVKDYDAADTELLIYATTLVNKTLNGIPDQDTYYDQVDALEEQGVEGAIQRYMSKQGTDLDLLRQFQIYEAVLHHEDGEEKGTPLKQLDETIRKTLRNRKSPIETSTLERRKSRRHSTGTSPLSASLNRTTRVKKASTGGDDDETGSSSSRSSPGPGEVPHLNGSYKDKQTGDAGVTPALRRRRERAERQRSFIREQQESSANLRASLGLSQEGADDENELGSALSPRISFDGSNKLNRVSSRKDLTPLMNAVNKLDSADNESKSPDSNGILKNPWSRMYNNNGEDAQDGDENNGDDNTPERKLLLQLKRENTVKDLTQKLASQNILNSPVEEKVISRIGDMSGLISKAKEGLAKSKSKQEILKSPSGDVPKLVEVKKSETELHWEELVSGMSRPLEVCDLDFTDLMSDDEADVLSPALIANGIPPPPPPAPMPPMGMKDGPPPPPPNRLGSFVPPPCPLTTSAFGVNLKHQRSTTATSPDKAAPPTPASSKTKKTVKLFWKEVRDDPMGPRQTKVAMIWDELNVVAIDTQKLEHLFESRAKDLITKKQQELNKTKEVIVLDHKRSNAINIGMTKLPPPRSIKTAIMKMDATIMTREGIEKLLTMLPTEDEQSRIQEAQMANPEMPLGSAEQFLLTLASISELSARLKLWAFKLDYENSEKEIADPLMDLKQGVETLRANKTFRGILSTLLSIGIFLNGSEVKGFQIEYLAKVPEVKDTVHKHSLLHHLCHMVMEKFPDATDLYSEIGAVTRASKVDFDELATNIVKMEQECKASWDHLKDIAKHDGSTIMKVKMTDFLADCAERIIVLGIVHRRVMNRYHKFLLWLGVPIYRVTDMKPNELCRIVSEFSLEYRTTRERVLQQLEKKANHRERNKTRGKMITEVGKFRTKEDRADAELRQLLGTPVAHHGSDMSDAETPVHGSLPWRRQRKDAVGRVGGVLAVNGGHAADADDEILESLVKTATKAPGTRTMPRERKRTRHADLKRSRTRDNNVGGEGSASP